MEKRTLESWEVDHDKTRILVKKEGKVIVHCLMEYWTRGDGQLIAARIWQLGLTGYGWTVEQAEDSVEKMFVHMVKAYEDKGLLAKHLDDSGVKWMWDYSKERGE